MLSYGETLCPACGGVLSGYDHVKRVVRLGDKGKRVIEIRRLKCRSCGKLHRELPDFLLPRKQYEKGIYEGMMDGKLNSDMLGYENFPAEMTVIRWKREKNSLLNGDLKK